MIRMLSADDKLAEIKRLYYLYLPRHHQRGFRESHRAVEVDVVGGGTGASRCVYGRPVADAIGLGKAGEKPDAPEESEKVESEK